jgi:bidirectional [NiFe] hydrogenase diaphorase subunit
MALSLTINGTEVSAEPGESLLDVARQNNVQIPSLCHHPNLTPYGACRLCLVEVTKGGRTKLTTSCNYEVQDGIEVQTNTDEIKEHRQMVIGLLIGQAPNAPRLQTLAKAYGKSDIDFGEIDPPAGRENCILCGMCSRVCGNTVGASGITLTGRGNTKGIQVPYADQISDACIGCAACASICPTNSIDMETIKVNLLRKQPATGRPCRYAMMGLMNGAICANNYECAKCEVDQRFFEACYPDHPIFAARGLTELKF